VIGGLVTAFFGNCEYRSIGGQQKKIDQSTSIVAETEQILNGPNFLSKSRAQIFDVSGGRCCVVQ
jgi:hypothetical protein